MEEVKELEDRIMEGRKTWKNGRGRERTIKKGKMRRKDGLKDEKGEIGAKEGRKRKVQVPERKITDR